MPMPVLDLLHDRPDSDPVVWLPSTNSTVDAARLRRLGSRLAGVLPEDRRCLVQLVAGRDVETLATYVACLRLGHAVLIVDERLHRSRLDILRRTFRPDVVVDRGPVDDRAYPVASTLGHAAMRVRVGGDVPEPMPEQVAVLLATSGSLGGFKVVCLSYGNVHANGTAIVSALDLRDDDRAALSVPVGFSYGLSVVNSHLLAGSSLVLITGSPSGQRFWRDFHTMRCTTFAGVPETYRLLSASGHDWCAHPSLRLATQAGGRMPAERVRDIADTLAPIGAELAVMYGQTEATARIACHRGESVRVAPHTVGGPLAGTRVWIADTDGGSCPDGRTGQVMVSGPGVMLGYAHDRSEMASLPSRPADALATGDLGRWDGSRLEIQGRLARLVKPLGVRVELDEVEAAFTEYGSAAVIADGDMLRVFVEGNILRFRPAYRRVLDAYRLPPAAVRMVGVPAIPRTASGKIAYGRIAELTPEADDA